MLRFMLAPMLVLATVMQVPPPQPAIPVIAGTLDAPQNGLVEMRVDNIGDKTLVMWFIDPDPPGYREIGNEMVFSGPSGPYKVRAMIVSSDATGKLSKHVLKTTATIAGKKPDPPGPVTPPPEPEPATDALTAAFQAAYNATTERDDTRKVFLGRLIFLYDDAIKDATTDKKLTTWKAFHDRMEAARESLIPGDKAVVFYKLRKAVQDEVLDKAFPKGSAADAPFDDAARALAAKTFARVVQALKGVKP